MIQHIKRKSLAIGALGVGLGPRSRVGVLTVLALPCLLVMAGCGITPRNFRGMTHPAAITRARAATLGRGLPEAQVIPTLIDRLNDPDPVVRLSSHEELRRRSGQDFGYVPWVPPEERAEAVQKWRGWWEQRQRGQVQAMPRR